MADNEKMPSCGGHSRGKVTEDIKISGEQRLGVRVAAENRAALSHLGEQKKH